MLRLSRTDQAHSDIVNIPVCSVIHPDMHLIPHIWIDEVAVQVDLDWQVHSARSLGFRFAHELCGQVVSVVILD